MACFQLLTDTIAVSRRKAESYNLDIETANQRHADLQTKLLETESNNDELSYQLREWARKHNVYEESISTLRMNLSSMQEELNVTKQELATEQANFEVKSAELIRQNCALQAEIVKLSSDSLYARNTFDMKMSEEWTKVRSFEQTIAQLQQEIVSMNANNKALQIELVEAETNVTNTHLQFQRLHRDAAELVERAVKEKKSHMQREGIKFYIYLLNI